ncbi:MAG: hypothetical protein H5T65_01965 [Chloroflexi bacterium]|nr:hypothetical protein [Chloroflexota bacterium]
MPAPEPACDLPILLLHDVDPTLSPSDLNQVLADVNALESALREQGHSVVNVPVRDADLAARLRDFAPNEFLVFNWCESLPDVPHSEALVAEVLERQGYTYTGSPPDVLARSWEKHGVKTLLCKAGVPTPVWRVYDSDRLDGWHRFPAIVKPAREHCSLGVTPQAVVVNAEELRRRIAYVLDTFHQPALVEDFIDGRELHVSLWGNGRIEMLPPAEMDFSKFTDMRDRLCSYDSKFTPGTRPYEEIGLKVPAPLVAQEYACLRRTCLLAYRALGCRDYARLDIRLRDGTFYVLDVNPNPDISGETSTVYAAKERGYTYGAMLSRIANLATHRHPLFGAARRH